MYARHDADLHAPTPAAGAFAGLIRSAADLLARWRAETARHQAELALSRMDEHLLRDIGANGRNIERLVREGRDD